MYTNEITDITANENQMISKRAALYHGHKKQKDRLETRVKLAVLCTYYENQAILEHILLYRASKCKQTK